MPLYKVLAVKEGVTLDYRAITKDAIATFPSAFKDGNLSRFGHPTPSLPYPPEIGIVKQAYNEDEYTGYADIEFDEDFARNFETDNKYEISLYAMCVVHWDDDSGLLMIDEMLYNDNNSIDVVERGAVLGAKVLEPNEFSAKEGSKQCFVRCSLEMVSSAVDVKPDGKEIAMDRQEILDAIKEGLSGETVADTLLERITDTFAGLVADIAPEPTALPAVDTAKIASEAFVKGATSGLDNRSVERVAAQISEGKTVEDAVETETALVKEFQERFAAQGTKAQAPEGFGCHAYIGNGATGTMSAHELMGVEVK
jgi:hypothetical protein